MLSGANKAARWALPMVLFPAMRPVFRYLWRKFPGDSLKRSDAERHVVGFVYNLIKAERATTARNEAFDIRELLTSMLGSEAHCQQGIYHQGIIISRALLMTRCLARPCPDHHASSSVIKICNSRLRDPRCMDLPGIVLLQSPTLCWSLKWMCPN